MDRHDDAPHCIIPISFDSNREGLLKNLFNQVETFITVTKYDAQIWTPAIEGGGIAGSGMGGAMAQGGGSCTIQDGEVNDGVVSLDAICDFLQFWEDVRIATCDYAIYCASPDPTGFPRYKVFAAPCPPYAGQTIQYECVPML
jgi:hypothetical protein